jgi:hypothetical protein
MNDLMTTLSHAAVACLDHAVFYVPANHPNHHAVVEQLSAFGLRLARQEGFAYERHADAKGTRLTFGREME